MDEHLNLSYPCPWDYQVIGEDEDSLRQAVEQVLAGAEHVLTLSNRSAKGRYLSLQLTVTVRDEVERLDLFEALRQHPAVRFVL